MERKKKILSSSNDNTKKESCIDSPVEKRKRGRPPKKKIIVVQDDIVDQIVKAAQAAARTPEAIEEWNRRIREREREREEKKEMNLHDKWDGESVELKDYIMRRFLDDTDILRVGEGLRMYTKYILTDFCKDHKRNRELIPRSEEENEWERERARKKYEEHKIRIKAEEEKKKNEEDNGGILEYHNILSNYLENITFQKDDRGFYGVKYVR